MKLNSEFAAIRAPGIFIAAILMMAFMGACHDRLDSKDQDHPAQTGKGPAQVLVENGQIVLTLDAPTQNRLGLEVATLAATATREHLTSPAVVLSVQDLVTLRNSYVATQAQLDKARVQAEVSRKEYTRLNTLFQQNQNISEKLLQAAEGTLQANNADVRAQEEQLGLQESIAKQEWGGVAATWAIKGTPELQRILDQRDVLVQVTVPTTAMIGPASSISFEIPGGRRTEARFVSVFPRVDPRIQGRSFLYRTPAQPLLAPGVNLLASYSVGSQMQGVIVPISAVVWSEGKAWVYQQIAADRFARRSLATDIAVERGFFVSKGLLPGEKVVVQGAQSLLSEELLLHGQAGGAIDED